MSRNTHPQDVGHLLRGLFREHKREPALTLNQLREHWTAIAGTEMGSRTRPAKLERGTLWVDTPDACWAYELQFFKQDLLNSIEAFIKSPTVTDLRFTVAREPQIPASTKGGQDNPSHSPGESIPAESIPAESIPAESIPAESIPAESTGVNFSDVKISVLANPAGNPPSPYESEAQDTEIRHKSEGRAGGDIDGGETLVRDAFQRMRNRRERR